MRKVDMDGFDADELKSEITPMEAVASIKEKNFYRLMDFQLCCQRFLALA